MTEKKEGIFYGWYIVLACFFALFMVYGARYYSFGVFFKPLSREFGWSRTLTSSAFAMSTIVFGIASLAIGKLVDKYGAKIVMITGTIVGGSGFMLIYFTESLFQFYLFYSVIMTIGMTATALVPTNALIAKWFAKKRGIAMGIISAGTGVGPFIIINLAEWMIQNFGWRISFVLMGAIVLIVLIPVISFIIKNDPQEMGLQPDGEVQCVNDACKSAARTQDRTWTLKDAVKTRGFWLVSAAYFMYLILYNSVIVHLVPHATDIGHNQVVAAFAMSLLMGFSIPGKIGCWLADKYSIKNVLAGTIALSMLSVVVFLNILGVKSLCNLYLFVAIFGMAYGSVLPLISALIAQLYGVASFGAIYGGVLMISMIGNGLGPLITGMIFDSTHSYDIAFMAGSVMLAVSACLIYSVRTPKSSVLQYGSRQ
jgi:MFS family permease